MRQGQNGAKRGRSRGRRQSNPGNRSYESNGPDVKVRGNAATIVEKYQTLARDAASSGDRVMAENYLQHAEHYQRLLNSAAQANAEREAQYASHQDNADNADDASEAYNQDNDAADDAAEDEMETEADVVEVEEKPKRKPRKPRKPKIAAEESSGDDTPPAEAAE